MGKALMVQGTASSVGKSTLVAGLCRIFADEGLRVAPFKAQNMALNSFATPEGLEIGRAQAVQAQAARVPPRADMNPILLKPEGQARSQIVLGGRVWGALSAGEYQRRKEEFWPQVAASLARLLTEFDLVLIEGAGSPVEVNLKQHDIVNMRVARFAQAPVVLVADIDRGGVFASLVGTMALLDPPEQELVAGLVINKFRGDPALLQPGIEFLERRLGRPVLGVVPWVDTGLPAEDSQGLDEQASPDPPPPPDAGLLDIAVVRLPRLANFDDFDPLAARPGVRLRYVRRPEELGRPDLLILPGTKTTRADLEFLRESGLAPAVCAYVKSGGAGLGVCGGFQLLGQWIDDPAGVEGAPGCSAGLGLLPAATRFGPEKATVQVRARVEPRPGLLSQAAGLQVTAYEIHMGRTEGQGPAAFRVQRSDGAGPDGLCSADGWTVGTYLHGLFHNRDFREAVLAALAERRALVLPSPEHPVDPYDRLAAVLRACLDLERIRAVAGL